MDPGMDAKDKNTIDIDATVDHFMGLPWVRETAGDRDPEDLRGIAYLGARRAAERFDAARGNLFKTYAEPAMKNAIIDQIRFEDGKRATEPEPPPQQVSKAKMRAFGYARDDDGLAFEPSSDTPQSRIVGGTNYSDHGERAVDAAEQDDAMLEALTHRQRQAVHLTICGNRTYEQLGDALGCSKQSAERLVKRTRERVARTTRSGRGRWQWRPGDTLAEPTSNQDHIGQAFFDANASLPDLAERYGMSLSGVRHAIGVYRDFHHKTEQRGVTNRGSYSYECIEGRQFYARHDAEKMAATTKGRARHIVGGSDGTTTHTKLAGWESSTSFYMSARAICALYGLSPPQLMAAAKNRNIEPTIFSAPVTTLSHAGGTRHERIGSDDRRATSPRTGRAATPRRLSVEQPEHRADRTDRESSRVRSGCA